MMGDKFAVSHSISDYKDELVIRWWVQQDNQLSGALGLMPCHENIKLVECAGSDGSSVAMNKMEKIAIRRFSTSGSELTKRCLDKLKSNRIVAYNQAGEMLVSNLLGDN